MSAGTTVVVGAHRVTDHLYIHQLIRLAISASSISGCALIKDRVSSNCGIVMFIKLAASGIGNVIFLLYHPRIISTFPVNFPAACCSAPYVIQVIYSSAPCLLGDDRSLVHPPIDTACDIRIVHLRVCFNQSEGIFKLRNGNADCFSHSFHRQI